MKDERPEDLRRKLLAVPGIGPETADSIALYAAGHPFFVVDAYTRRVFARLGLLRGDESYAEVQRFFRTASPATRPSTTTTTPSSSASRRTTAAPAPAATAARLRISARLSRRAIERAPEGSGFVPSLIRSGKPR